MYYIRFGDICAIVVKFRIFDDKKKIKIWVMCATRGIVWHFIVVFVLCGTKRNNYTT